MFGSSLTVFCLKMGTKQNKHSHSAVESRHYTVTGVKRVLKIFVSGKEKKQACRDPDLSGSWILNLGSWILNLELDYPNSELLQVTDTKIA